MQRAGNRPTRKCVPKWAVAIAVVVVFGPGTTWLIAQEATLQSKPSWRELVGQRATKVDSSMEMAGKAELSGDFRLALAHIETAAEILQEDLPAEHWKLVDCRAYLKTLRRASALSVADQQRLADAKERESRVRQLSAIGAPRRAVAAAKEALEIRSELLGEEDAETVRSQLDLAIQLETLWRFEEAIDLARDVVKKRTRFLGPRHPYTASAKSQLAVVLARSGRAEEAISLQKESLAALIQELGMDNPLSLDTLNNAALSLAEAGQFGPAESYLRACLAADQKLLGRLDQRTANSHKALATLLSAKGHHLGAVRQIEAANSIYAAIGLGLSSRHVRHSQLLLAQALAAIGGPENTSIELLERLLANTPDGETGLRAMAFEKLADIAFRQGDYDQASGYYMKAFREWGTISSDASLLRASSVAVGLARAQAAIGETEEASRMLEMTVGSLERVLQTPDFRSVSAHTALGLNAWASGHLGSARESLTTASKEYSECRARYHHDPLVRTNTALRSPIQWLALLAARKDPRRAWELLESDLAVGLLEGGRSRRLRRQLDRDGLSEFQKLTADLNRIERLLLFSPVYESEGETQRLRSQAEAIRERIATFQADLAIPNTISSSPIALDEIQRAIPAGTALVCWLTIHPLGKANGPHAGRALVLTENGPVSIDLPNLSREPDSLSRLRKRIAQPPSELDASLLATINSSIADLRKQYVDPLATYLKTHSEQKVRRLVVLPSDELLAIPIELIAPEFEISYAPSATTFVQLTGAGDRKLDHLTVIGAPNFHPPTWMKTPQEITDLPGTAIESTLIANLYDDPAVYLGDDASEQQVESLRSDRTLEQTGVLHLATHARISHVTPELSCLLMARSTLPAPEVALAAGEIPFSGRLALEDVIRTWNLDNCDLVVASACSSGGGDFRGGEGLFGFSTAFLLAGARSCVVTLWPVDDRAACLLMVRFHENLVGKRTDHTVPMSKVAALAEAKSWLRGASLADLDRYLKRHVDSARNNRDLAAISSVAEVFERFESPQWGPTRTLRGEGPTVGAEAGASLSIFRPFSEPYYWAPFILIGDPG